MYMLLLPIKNDKKARTKRCGPSCCFVVQSIQIESGTMKLLLVALTYHLETIANVNVRMSNFDGLRM